MGTIKGKGYKIEFSTDGEHWNDLSDHLVNCNIESSESTDIPEDMRLDALSGATIEAHFVFDEGQERTFNKMLRHAYTLGVIRSILDLCAGMN